MAYTDDALTQRSNLAFFRALMRISILSREDEKQLVEAWCYKKDVASLHILISAYQRLVASLGLRFMRYELPFSDLIQEGNIGLLQAALRFDPSRNLRFATYASWWIRSSMQNFVLRNWSIVRTGTTVAQKTLFFNLRHLKNRINNQGTPPLKEELYRKVGEELNLSPAEVEAMDKRLMLPDQSLNELDATESGEIMALLKDSRATPEEECINHKNTEQRREWIHSCLSILTEKERAVITIRQLSDENISLRKAAEVLKLSKERVRQLEANALRKLKIAMEPNRVMAHDLYE